MVYLLRSRCPNYFRRYGNPPQSSKLRMTTKSVRTRDGLHALIIIVFGLVAAYIYETTGKLLLCIVFHGVGNAFVMSAPLVGYLLGM